MTNANIILQGQGPQPVNALSQGMQVGQQYNDIKRTNEMRAMLKQNGAGIMAGDQQSLNALAGFDPDAALGVQANQLGQQQTRQGMAHADQRMAMLSREEQRAIDAQAAQMGAAERAAEAAKIEQAVAMGLQAQTPQQWDAMVGQMAPDLVGQFDNREAIAGRFMSVADSLKRFDERNAAPEPAAPMSTLGKFYADQAAGLIPADAQPPTSGVNVTTNVGGDPDVFRNELDKKSAAMFTTLYDQLPNAQSKIARVENLAQLLEASPTGAEASVKSWLGGFGIETEGLSAVQALDAAINQMVPAQRTPGSGPMSDADLALFKRSLPRLINTPEGNRTIIETMRGLAQYEASQAAIAAQVVSGQMTRAQGQDALMALPNPLANMQDPPAAATQGSESDIPQAGQVVDGYRFKGGDPSQQSSWEKM